MYLEFEIEGEKHISAVLGFAADHMGDFKRPFYRTGQLIMNDVETNYNRRGELFGGWKPRKYSHPWPPLEKTGRMRRSFRTTVRSDHVKIENTDMPKFGYHQSNKPRKKIPRRVMLTVIQPTRTNIYKAFQEHVVESLQARTV